MDIKDGNQLLHNIFMHYLSSSNDTKKFKKWMKAQETHYMPRHFCDFFFFFENEDEENINVKGVAERAFRFRKAKDR